MNLKILLVLIGIMICYLDSPFVVILILGLSFLESLSVLWISSTFFNEILGKFSLIFKISLTLRNNACVYDYLSLLLVFLARFLPLFLKNFDFFRISSLSLEGIGDRTLVISAFFSMFNVSFFLVKLLLIFLGENFNTMFYYTY